MNRSAADPYTGITAATAGKWGPNMSRPRTLAIGGLAIAVIVAVALLWPAPARPVTITITAPAGTKINGYYDADGATTAIYAEGPTEIAVTCREVDFLVYKDDQPGEMTVRIAVEGLGHASATASAGGTVLGGFASGRLLRTGSVSFWATNSQASP